MVVRIDFFVDFIGFGFDVYLGQADAEVDIVVIAAEVVEVLVVLVEGFV